MEIGWDPLIILLTGYVRRSGTMLITCTFEGILLSGYPSREEAGLVLVQYRGIGCMSASFNGCVLIHGISKGKRVHPVEPLRVHALYCMGSSRPKANGIFV